jgi:hypothetical protein
MLRLSACGPLATLLIATTTSAQPREEPAPASASAPAAATAPAPAPASASAPVVPPSPPAESDHDQFVHHLAVGYFGTSLLPIGVPPGAPGLPPTGGTVTAPTIGVRYWFSRRVGLDAGLGVGFSAGSQTVNSASASAPTSFGFAVHAGLPIAIASASHYVFEIVPETLVGVTTGTIFDIGAPNQTISGFLLNWGGRVGAEIHFGFIGIPNLALQGSVGIYFSYQSFSWSQSGSSASVQSTSFATSVQASPWAIFTDNLSALYYF